MQTANLKLDIITWVSGLNDKKILEELYLWKAKHQGSSAVESKDGFIPPERKGELTEGFGLWADMTEETEDFRKRIWQTDRNTW